MAGKKRLTKAELEQRRELAFMYYMNGETQKVIAEKVDISETTISKWAKEDAWVERRGANTISREEIVKQLLRTVNSIVERINETEDPIQREKDTKQLAGLTKTIETLDKKNGLVSTVETFTSFHHWLSQRAMTDKGITTDFLKQVNPYQDKYVNEALL